MSALAEAPVGKRKFPRAEAIAVARELIVELAALCQAGRLVVAGSLRRRRPEVGDLELVYIPQVIEAADPGDLFGKKVRTNAVDLALEQLIEAGALERRLNSAGHPTWGKTNKLARHIATGLPVDFFAATPGNFFSLLVCRTGPVASNIIICQTAIEHGWRWDPYLGFVRKSLSRGESIEYYEPKSEAEVFTWFGLEYRQPWERE